MTAVDIEYCVPFDLRDYAVETQERSLDAFGRDRDGVPVQPGHGDVSSVHAGDGRVWARADHDGETDTTVITEAIHDRIHA